MTATLHQLELEQLKTLIEKKREQMINNGIRYGFTNSKTISLSEELDKLIHEFLTLLHSKEENS